MTVMVNSRQLTLRTAKENARAYRRREKGYRKAAAERMREGLYAEAIQFLGLALRQEAYADAWEALVEQAKSA